MAAPQLPAGLEGPELCGKGDGVTGLDWASSSGKLSRGTNSRITEAEERMGEVEDRRVEINEAQRKKELKEMRTTPETSGKKLNAPTFKS